MRRVLLATTMLVSSAVIVHAQSSDPCAAVTTSIIGQPAPAALAGYNTLTLSPTITVGKNWLPDTQDTGQMPNITQNADGSLTVAGGADTWNAQMESAEQFGGGFYAQATMATPGPTSCLASFDNCGNNTGPGNQWPSFWANAATPTGGMGIETDIVEQMSPVEGHYGSTVINWTQPSGGQPNTGWTQDITAPNGNTLHGANTYGMLWIPATATTGGSLTFFLNGQPVGQPITWTQANPGSYGLIDSEQMTLRFGAGANSPATFSNIQVWQASTAHDSINGQPAPAIAPGTQVADTPGQAQAACEAAMQAASTPPGPSAAPAVAAVPSGAGNPLSLAEAAALAANGTAPAGVQPVAVAAPATGPDPGAVQPAWVSPVSDTQPALPPPTITAPVNTVNAPTGQMPTPDPVSETTSFDASGDFQTVVPSPGNATGTVSGNDNIIAATGGIQTITVSGSGNQLILGPYSDTVTLTASGNTIDGGGGNDTIVLQYPATTTTAASVAAGLAATPAMATQIAAAGAPSLAHAGNIFMAPALGTGTLTITGSPLSPLDRIDLTPAVIGLAGYTGTNVWNYVTETSAQGGGCTLSVQSQAVVVIATGCPTGQTFVKAEQ